MNNSNIINKIAEHYNLSYLLEKDKSKGKGKKGKDDSGQHGEDIREHHHKLKSLGKDDDKNPSDDKDPSDPDDHDEEEEDEEEEIDFRIIDMAYAAVRELVTFVSISDHKKVALEVLTTATQYSLCLCLS